MHREHGDDHDDYYRSDAFKHGLNAYHVLFRKLSILAAIITIKKGKLDKTRRLQPPRQDEAVEDL
jgi:hypothetical protein